MIFKQFSDESISELIPFYRECRYIMSDYSLGLKLMWSDALNSEYSVKSDALIVKNRIDGKVSFDYPIPLSSECDERSVLLEISEYCRENFIPLVFGNVPKDKLDLFLELFPRYEISFNRKYSDYVYPLPEMSKMSGRRYSGQRNHINKFKKLYENAVFVTLSEADIPRIEKLFKKASAGISRDAEKELSNAARMLRFVGKAPFLCGGYTVGEELISFCMAEKCGDTLIDHIEKALPEYDGVYPATVKAVLEAFGGDLRYFNREDDSSDKGLRMSKLQYKPEAILNKYSVAVKNELSSLEKAPVLFSKRLIYTALTEDDAEEYYRLSTDPVLNKYWGYDYRESCPEPSKDFFYLDQKKDFDNRMTLTFAIRQLSTLVGEVILYNFDYRGSCEIGIRVFPEYSHRGYGRESLERVIDFALYGLGMSSVNAKCFKENECSLKMLSRVMRKNGEDSKYYCFLSEF